MGLDLTLLPIECEVPNNRYAHAVLNTTRAWDIQRGLEERGITPLRVGAPLACYLGRGDDGDLAYGEITDDKYGKELTFVSAGELMQLAFEPYITISAQNRATWSYLGELPPQMRVALLWK